MRRILEALIIDRRRITDALIDERQAAATRPGAGHQAQTDKPDECATIIGAFLRP